MATVSVANSRTAPAQSTRRESIFTRGRRSRKPSAVAHRPIGTGKMKAQCQFRCCTDQVDSQTPAREETLEATVRNPIARPWLRAGIAAAILARLVPKVLAA